MPKDHAEQWIDEPFETPHYPSEADMHKCACVEWQGHEGEGWDIYKLQGGLNLPWVQADEAISAPSLSGERLALYQWTGDEYLSDEVYLEIDESSYNSGVPTQPYSGIRLYCDGGELWIIRSDGSTTQLS